MESPTSPWRGRPWPPHSLPYQRASRPTGTRNRPVGRFAPAPSGVTYCCRAVGTDRTAIQGPGADLQERLGIAGSGAIACGLAVTAARNGRRAAVGALGRARPSAPGRDVAKTCAKLADEGSTPSASGSSTVSTRWPRRPSWSRRSSSTTAARRGCWPSWPRARRAATPSSRPRPRRCRSRELARADAATPSASSACTCSTRCRGWSWSSWRSRRRPPTTTARPRAGAVRGARQDRRSRSPTSRASSSTGCCSRTCSARSS